MALLLGEVIIYNRIKPYNNNSYQPKYTMPKKPAWAGCTKKQFPTDK